MLCDYHREQYIFVRFIMCVFSFHVSPYQTAAQPVLIQCSAMPSLMIKINDLKPRVINKEWHEVSTRGEHIIWILTYKQHTVRMINLGHLTFHMQMSAATLGSSTGGAQSSLPSMCSGAQSGPLVPRHTSQMAVYHPMGETFGDSQQPSGHQESRARFAASWPVLG